MSYDHVSYIVSKWVRLFIDRRRRSCSFSVINYNSTVAIHFETTYKVFGMQLKEPRCCSLAINVWPGNNVTVIIRFVELQT